MSLNHCYHNIRALGSAKYTQIVLGGATLSASGMYKVTVTPGGSELKVVFTGSGSGSVTVKPWQWTRSSLIPKAVPVLVCNETEDYRFGFNGQEKVNEIAGIGNSLDFKFRNYDTRIARFYAVDPLTSEYPYYTPYQFAGNNPIRFIDREGLEPAESPHSLSPKNTPHFYENGNSVYLVNATDVKSQLAKDFWITAIPLPKMQGHEYYWYSGEGQYNGWEFLSNDAENAQARAQAAYDLSTALAKGMQLGVLTTLAICSGGVGFSWISAGSATVDFTLQYANKGDIGEVNLISPVSQLFLKSPGGAAYTGSQYRFTLNRGFEINNDMGQVAQETIIGGATNKLGDMGSNAMYKNMLKNEGSAGYKFLIGAGANAPTTQGANTINSAIDGTKQLEK